jgi:SAM-dependent methyltransferase
MAETHKDLVREEFTRQAPGYAEAPVIKDPLHLQKLIDEVKPDSNACVLEVATGPGHVALAFARVCREVVGVDLTEAPLKIAERMRLERGITNARFIHGDVEARLPFADFEDPKKVIAEMSRLCRVGGTVAIEDLISSEHRERADYYNRYEQLRDSSHTRALPLSELITTMAATGLEIVRFSSDGLTNPVERWFDQGFTPPDKRKEALAMIERDLAEDLTGANPRRVDGKLYFTHRTAIVVARKLKPRT